MGSPEEDDERKDKAPGKSEPVAARLCCLAMAVLLPGCLLAFLFFGRGSLRGGRFSNTCSGYPFKLQYSTDLDLTVFTHRQPDPDVDFLRGKVLTRETPFSSYYHFYKQVGGAGERRDGARR